MAQCLRSETEVDGFFAHLKQQGITITKMPEKVFWGVPQYCGNNGYFTDSDGHL